CKESRTTSRRNASTRRAASTSGVSAVRSLIHLPSAMRLSQLRQGDKETRRQGDRKPDLLASRLAFLYPLVSLSPCLLVTLSPCLGTTRRYSLPARVAPASRRPRGSRRAGVRLVDAPAAATRPRRPGWRHTHSPARRVSAVRAAAEIHREWSANVAV